MFAPDSAIRRVHGEGILVLGGGRALLMQLAHPLVARGVAEHSRYRDDRIARLLGTLRPMYAIAFGTTEQAEAAARHVRRMHERVVGQDYRADDPALMRWVLATLIDTSLVMHRRFVGPVAPRLAEAYYRDMCDLGETLGLPPTSMPASLDEMDDYVREVVGTLEVTPTARALARELFAPMPEAPWLSPLMPLVRELTAGLLPPELRVQFGMPWGPRRARALDVTEQVSRALLPCLPASLRRPPWFLMPATERTPRRHPLAS